MSTNALTDLDQRRNELGAELQSCIQENVMHKRRAEEIARHKAELTQNLTRMRITCAEVNANVQDLEERKKSLEAIIEAENARVTVARDELAETERQAQEARKECKQAFEMAVADVSQCYRVDCNKDHLKKEIFETNERITGLKRQALLVQASTLALLNQTHMPSRPDSGSSNSEMIDSASGDAMNEDKYLEQLQNRAHDLQQEVNTLTEELNMIESETMSSPTSAHTSMLEPKNLTDIMELAEQYNPETATSEDTVRLTTLLSKDLLAYLTPMLENMYTDVETGLKTAISGTDPQVQLDQIYCARARQEVQCGASILSSFGETCQKLLERVEGTSQLATRLLEAPLDVLQEELGQSESQQN